MIVIGFATPGRCFPPAPSYVLFGLVRDQLGTVLDADGASLVVTRDGTEVGRALIRNNRLDQNYEVALRIDANRPALAIYHERAIAADGWYSLHVEMNGSRFYPIEVRGDLQAGRGGERVRLDLTLGEDLDGDGLPDIWEEWQLYQAGYGTDDAGRWPIELIDREGDFDGDGRSNGFEYIAGTFAGDASVRFELKIVEKRGNRVDLEFYAITRKTYTIERGTHLGGWEAIPFTVTPGGDAATFHRATSSGVRTITCASSSSGEEFFRLTVR